MFAHVYWHVQLAHTLGIASWRYHINFMQCTISEIRSDTLPCLTGSSSLARVISLWIALVSGSFLLKSCLLTSVFTLCWSSWKFYRKPSSKFYPVSFEGVWFIVIPSGASPVYKFILLMGYDPWSHFLNFKNSL